MNAEGFHIVAEADADEIRLARAAGKIVVVVAPRPEHVWSLGAAATWAEGWLGALGIEGAENIIFAYCLRGRNRKKFGREVVARVCQAAASVEARKLRGPGSSG